MSHTIFSRDEAINEGTTFKYSATLEDEDGVALAQADVSAIVCWLKSIAADGTEAAVNSRTNQSVLNANGGTFGAGGAFAQILGPLDTVAIAGPANEFQERRFTLKVTYTGGQLTHAWTFWIRPLADIT